MRGLERAKWRLWHGDWPGCGCKLAARRRRGEPIATSFVESAVDEIIAWRMAKAQQMRWSKPAVQPFLDVRIAVLNGTLEDAFRRRYAGCRPANDDQVLPAAA